MTEHIGKNFNLDSSSGTPLYRQIVDNFIRLVENGELEKGDKIPAINALHKALKVGRVTVVNAYREMKERGLIDSTHGKGFFIKNPNIVNQKRIFLLFDSMNDYKQVLYRSFVNELGDRYQVESFFHYYNLKQFTRFINNNLGQYNYYVLLPHFNQDISYLLDTIPKEKLLLVDADITKFTGDYPAVFQNFKADVYNSLKLGLNQIQKYKKLNLAVNLNFQFIPDGMIAGFEKFCKDFNIDYTIYDNLTYRDIKTNEAYFVVSENDLINVVKFTIENELQLGKEIGLISYDDTPLKSILAGGITVISTDFEQMGKMAAKMIKEKITNRFENPARLILRNSL